MAENILTIGRRFAAEDGTEWEAVATETIVAHGRPGALLAFVPTGEEGVQPLPSTITFNSMSAAEFALRTMSEKDLRRRLALIRQAAGGV